VRFPRFEPGTLRQLGKLHQKQTRYPLGHDRYGGQSGTGEILPVLYPDAHFKAHCSKSREPGPCLHAGSAAMDALLQQLQPYLPLDCLVRSLQKGRLPPQQCLLALLSKVLGYAIIAGATVLKVPQVCMLALQSYMLARIVGGRWNYVFQCS
jgi:hypothetical protein